ncbi:MAG TPA: PIN domain-containing protein [Blastocatellia bacterium]|nr:PIN domain-containing protein [Blastocatellia bacterium]HMV85249.1 PIN domain-containing protein [Blastocatellia bacterium]HMX25793.1 PIN domain-containing protein [Blastocatellia bacterium]HMZ17888.1 PIN domain-containing protein [Blastocatellia bacterium]HNG33300.1 PIN domain-containing protein [Blastocatellia bacterium]
MKLQNALAGVRRLFLDTAPVVYHIEGNPAYQPLTDIIFQQIQNGRLLAVTSPITLAECLVHPYRRGDLALIQKFRNTITKGAHTQYIGVDSSAERAAELRAIYNLTLTDALQIAAAIAAGCDAFLSNDVMLKRVTELPILILDNLEV